MAYEQTQLSLTPWTPTPTQIPLEWQTFITKETEIGSNYMSDERRVGDLLCSWGLPWPVVVAGYLLSFGEEVLYRANLQSATEVLEHHRNAIEYINDIDDDDLLTLLNPSYKDLGALLIAIAFHYLDLFKQSKGHAYIQKDVLQIEQIGSTLLSLVKRLGMWSFKRALEDLLLELCHPQQFLADAQQHQSIRQQDLSKLDEICQLFIRYYRETTQNPIMVTYTICGTAGLRRRQQDAHTTVTSE